ncbi:hypothetical protein FRC04_002920 [Tulasnella sp. 424]|nr:hypothetical protein FRC04_002920 [Tulasnella sp. 424]
MKALLLTALLAQALLPVFAHYTFPKLLIGDLPIVTNDWQYVRKTLNADTGAPLTDPTSILMRCYETSTAALTSTYIVGNAGTKVGFQANVPVNHPGYMSIYMAKATPFANSEAAGSGNVWFKVAQWSPTWTGGTFNWPYLCESTDLAIHFAELFAEWFVTAPSLSAVVIYQLVTTLLDASQVNIWSE